MQLFFKLWCLDLNELLKKSITFVDFIQFMLSHSFIHREWQLSLITIRIPRRGIIAKWIYVTKVSVLFVIRLWKIITSRLLVELFHGNWVSQNGIQRIPRARSIRNLLFFYIKVAVCWKIFEYTSLQFLLYEKIVSWIILCFICENRFRRYFSQA